MLMQIYRKIIVIFLILFTLQSIIYANTILYKKEQKKLFSHIISVGAIPESWYYSNSFYINRKNRNTIFSVSYHSFLQDAPTKYFAKFRLDVDVKSKKKWPVYSLFAMVGHKQAFRIYSYSIPLSYYIGEKGHGFGIFLNYRFKNEKFLPKTVSDIVFNLPISLMPLFRYNDNSSIGFILYPQLLIFKNKFLIVVESAFSYARIYSNGKNYFLFFPMVQIGYHF